ncbi:MAG: hypothetical protein J5726_10670 [Treponema sp.]|nr:hypothetical protein [Treponema sp.]MBO4534138.1 hypothetical protein [Treponema sp.]
MTEPCPVCESKRELSAMEMTPELVAEMAASEPVADFCGQDELDRRLSICGECPRLLNEMTCAECGCFVQFRARHATVHCANGLW